MNVRCNFFWHKKSALIPQNFGEINILAQKNWRNQHFGDQFFMCQNVGQKSMTIQFIFWFEFVPRSAMTL